MAIAVFALFNPLGADASGEIGEDPHGIPNNLAPYIMQVAIGKRPMLTVFGNDYDTPDGTCIRDYVHVVDLARGHRLALDYLGGQPQGFEVINLGSNQGYSVLEIIRAFERVIGQTVPYQIGNRRPGDVDRYVADTKKLKGC